MSYRRANDNGLKIAIVNGICVRGDAISESVLGTARALEKNLSSECCIFTYVCEEAEIPHRIVQSSTDILTDPFFLAADLVIYHFGIYYELFNAIAIGNGHAKQVVVYHNVTPKEHLDKAQHRLIDKSMAQVANISFADEVWADSEFNMECLREYGLSDIKIEVCHLYSKLSSEGGCVKAMDVDAIGLLYVGRFVKSKGVLELLEAVRLASAETLARFNLTLIGNVGLSDPAYIKEIVQKCAEPDLANIVNFVGKVDDATLQEAYMRAHGFVIASYHEGFCVPLVEAMRAGCVPVGFAAGNVASLIGPMGYVVPTGDVRGLADSIVSLTEFLGAQEARSRQDARQVPWARGAQTFAAYKAALGEYAETFSFESFSRRVTALASALLPARHRT